MFKKQKKSGKHFH